MNFSSLSAADKRLLITGALVALISLISFADPSGTWGAVMILGILGGLLAAFVAVQSQMAPTMKLPMTRGLSILVAGGAAVLGFAVAMLTYIGYITRNIADIFVILMIIGLVASIYLAWQGWLAYQAEPKTGTPPAAPPPPPAA